MRSFEIAAFDGKVLFAPEPGREVERFLGFVAGFDVISQETGSGGERGMRERVSPERR